MIISKSELIANFAKQAYSMAPGNRPRNIELAIEQITTEIEKTFENLFKRKNFVFLTKTINEQDLYVFLYKICYSSEEWRKWNFSDYEISQTSKNKPMHVIRKNFYDIDNAEYMSIDLDAFVNNLTREILWDQYFDGVVFNKQMDFYEKYSDCYAVRKVDMERLKDGEED